jgi:hypothetical protein
MTNHTRTIDTLSDSSDHDDDNTGSPNHTDTESVTSHHGVNDLNKKKSEDEAKKFAQRESWAVVRLRLIVIFVLLLSTMSVSLVVSLFATNAETREFENRFRDSSAKVMEALGGALDRTRGAADALSVILVAYSKTTNATWPFVTVPNFAVHAAKIQGLSKSEMVAVCPYVEDSQRAEWEAYSMQNAFWVNETIQMQKEDPNFYGPIIENWTASGTIYGNKGPVTTSGPYLPMWQGYPVIPVHASPTLTTSVDEVLASKEVVIGNTINLVSNVPFLPLQFFVVTT